MTNSGLKIDDTLAKMVSKELKTGDLKRTARCLIFKLSDDFTKLELEKVCDKHCSQTRAQLHQQMRQEALEQEHCQGGDKDADDDEPDYNVICKDDLPDKHSRYVVWDLSVRKGGDESKGLPQLIFMHWCPDTASIKEKMVAASSLNGVMKAFGMSGKCVTCNDKSDLEYKNVMSQVSK